MKNRADWLRNFFEIAPEKFLLDSQYSWFALVCQGKIFRLRDKAIFWHIAMKFRSG
jgi:hypothetical protein